MYETFLKQTYPDQQASMAAHTIDGEKVWLKRAAKRNSRLAYAPLKLLAGLTRIEALKPVPNLGGEQSIQTEVARLQALDAAGFNVPTVLAADDNALLLADAGTPQAPATTLLDALKRASTQAEVDSLLTLGLDSLVDLHRHDAYLSEAFARNILITEGKVVFIDFETDPGQVHTRVNCMVRDWYCLIFSLYGKLHKSPLARERLTPAFIAGLENEREDVVSQFKAMLPALLRLRKIPFKRLGGDGRKIDVTLRSLTALHEHFS
ncbi:MULTISPECIES: RIO1 family regulatory kinase/ATPase domain-containing protein [unclassified Vreelandella]